VGPEKVEAQTIISGVSKKGRSSPGGNQNFVFLPWYHVIGSLMTANGWPFAPTENEEVVWEVVVCVLLVPLEKVVVDIVCVLVEAEAVELLEVAVVVVAVDTRE